MGAFSSAFSAAFSTDSDNMPDYTTKFEVGDFAWRRKAAMRGDMTQRICVKHVNVPETSREVEIVYLDTTNSLWQERELATYDEAKALAQGYLEGQISYLSG